jgi:geranylgeranyl reductase family protein
MGDRRDVVVIGGGPAGSTVAALVARGGHDVLLLDRETFPRFRVGESLMPATYWTLERLGVLDEMKASDFPRKHSVQFFSRSGRSSMPFYFSEVDKSEASATWQVDRARFDAMLLENARRSGAEVRLQTNVKEVLFEGSRATGVQIETGAGESVRVGCRVVVDASGQTTMISRKLGLKEVDPKLRHVAYFTRYRGAQRDSGIDEGGTLILRTREDRSWFWFIPLPDDRVSVGVVGPIDYLVQDRATDPQTVYDEELALCPALQARLEQATQVAPATVLRDFSYISRQIAGDGWVLAGDAFGFLDPIYSSGVFLALKSAEFAADAILEAFRENDTSAATLGRFGQEYVDGMEAMRKLVYAYYTPEFSVARFLKANPEFREQVVDLLVGNVYRRPVRGLFEAMGAEIELPASRELAGPEESR